MNKEILRSEMEKITYEEKTRREQKRLEEYYEACREGYEEHLTELQGIWWS